MNKTPSPVGPKTQMHATAFLAAVKGVPLKDVKKVLAALVPNIHFFETSKRDLSLRIAKGKLSLGGTSESQRIRRLSLTELTQACQAHMAPTNKAVA